MRPSPDLFDISDVLGLHRQLASLVLEGRLYRLLRDPMGSGEPEFAELAGSRRRVELAGEVEALFSSTLEARSDQVEGFQARCLRLQPRPRFQVPAELKNHLGLHERLRFVAERLIPLFRRLTSSGGAGIDRSRDLGEFQPLEGAFQDLSPIERIPRNLVQEALGGDVLLLGHSVYDVTWTPDDVRPRDCYLQAQGERYSVNKTRRRSLMSLNGAFKNRLREALRGHIFEAENERLLDQARALEEDLTRTADVVSQNRTLYRDRERSVSMGRDGAIFCCQEVPPFVMEGADRKFRLFERVRVGVRLSSLEPEEVLSTEGAYVMARYDHLFVFHFGDLGRLCMGHDYAFFRRFWEMPLEEGIAEYLNAARLVICAGHFDASDGLPPYMPDEMAGRPRIGLREARRRKLPIYRYYRT